MPLCSQADVQKLLQITFTNNPEPVITYLIENAQAEIESYLGRTIENETGIIETIDGSYGRSEIRLSKWPVTAVNQVDENGVTLTTPTEYLWYEDGRVVRMNGDYDRRWLNLRQSIVVDYDAGYTVVPFDIRDVCARMVGRVFRAGAAYAATPKSASGAIRRISLDGSDSIEYSDVDDDIGSVMVLNETEKKTLSKYRKRLHL